jgi:hypothetical protein
MPGVGQQGGIPLVGLLVQAQILDDKSADYLHKAPYGLASEVLLSLGPEVRNPSGFITSRLKPFLGNAPQFDDGKGSKGGGKGKDWKGGAYPEYDAPYGGYPEYGSPYGKGGSDFGPVGGSYGKGGGPIGGSYGKGGGGGYGRHAEPLEAPRRQPKPGVAEQTSFEVHHDGKVITLAWDNQEQAVLELVSQGILDEGSADFLMQASEPLAKEVVSCLQEGVRNPSAFVTRKLKELKQTGNMPASARETFTVHFNGEQIPLQWTSKEQAVQELVSRGVLDDKSSDFLLKAPDKMAKEIVSALGPDVRNPSAFVTRRCAEMSGGGKGGKGHGGGHGGGHGCPTVPVFFQGQSIHIPWPNRDVALRELRSYGVLDDGSADFLGKLSEAAAWDIVSRLGPDVRNPSAFVTKECKKVA